MRLIEALNAEQEGQSGRFAVVTVWGLSLSRVRVLLPVVPRRTSVVYSYSTIYTVRSFTQYNPSTIFNFFPLRAVH